MFNQVSHCLPCPPWSSCFHYGEYFTFVGRILISSWRINSIGRIFFMISFLIIPSFFSCFSCCPMLSSYHPPGFLLDLMFFSCFSCYPPWFLMLIMLSLLSSLISHVIPLSILISLLSSHCPPCSFYVSSLLILMMIVIKSIWWCPPLLSSARWWCFMSVLSLWSDYRGWLLIIFISNILLWWYLFLSF